MLPRPSVDSFKSCAILLGCDWDVRTSERREVLLRRDASSKSSRGEAPYNRVSIITEEMKLLDQG